MLTEREKEFLAQLDRETLMSHLRNIASFNRRSDGEGERQARGYILERLKQEGISCGESSEPGILSFGREASVRTHPSKSFPQGQTFTAKSWNFSVSADSRPATGTAVVLTEGPSGILDLLSSMKPAGQNRDLAGRVVLSRFFSPPRILDAAARGAVAFVICWPRGDEKEIHHSGAVMWWGTPNPEESAWAPSIPVVGVNGIDGNRLIEAVEKERKGEIVLEVSSDCREAVTPVYRVEAEIPSTEGDPHFILLGAHLDSKYLGATDNATGAALLLSLAEAVSRLKYRKWGVKMCWWSGHEFGRYTGSSIYARDCFDELEEYCIACANADMPGMKDANNWTSITAGPDLFDLAAGAVLDVTGQKGVPSGRVRSWDQSFQNLGISTLFAWSSLLAPDSPCRTGRGNMPWWWHTEADTLEFCDPDVFETDAKLYMTGLFRLIASGEENKNQPFQVEKLWKAVDERLAQLQGELSGAADLSGVRERLGEGLREWRKRERSPEESLRAVRLLNRMWYSARASFLQDWGDGSEFVPGLSEAASLLRSGISKTDVRKTTIVVNYAKTQRNRLRMLAEGLKRLAAERPSVSTSPSG